MRSQSAQPVPIATAFGNREFVGLVGTNSIEYVQESLRLYETGAISVALRDAADAQKVLAGRVTRTITPGSSRGWARLSFEPRVGDEIAQVLFTSGTTGSAKAIALTCGNIADTTRRIIQAMEMDQSICEYIGVPVMHSFGLGRARAVAAVGGAFYIPPFGFSPSEIVGMLTRCEINAISAVPSLWRVLLQNVHLFGREAERVKWIEIGSQPMSREEKESMKSLFPNAVIVQHYGLTEASRSTFLHVHKVRGERLASVGKPEGGVEVEIAPDGHIRIRGRHVAPYQLSEGKLVPLTDAAGWLDTSDLGTLRNGSLWFEGRADDLINCGGIKLDPERIEQKLRETLGAATDVAVARLPDAVWGDGILVAYAAPGGTPGNTVHAAAVVAIEQLGVRAGTAVKVTDAVGIARTDNGKIRRAALVEAFLALESGDREAAFTATGDAGCFGLEAELVLLWRQAVGGKSIGPDDSFFDIGGDSATAELLVRRMESLGVPADAARGLLDGLTIREIAELSERSSSQGVANATAEEARILEIWRQAIGRQDIGLDETFYDVGGDSLSAVSVALGLEGAGLDPQLAHGIFDGKTIRELAGELSVAREISGTNAVASAAPRSKSEMALLSEGSNFVKGVVLICMVSSHWVPVYLTASGLQNSRLAWALAPIFSLGSQTLAFVFGMGAAIFHARQYERSRPSFNRNIVMSTGLLFVGMLIGGVARLPPTLLRDQPLTALGVGAMFYGPFLYYFFATATLPLWVRGLKPRRRTLPILLISSAAAYAAYMALASRLPAGTQSPGAALSRDVLVGHWGLFQMASISLFGAAVGIVVRMHLERGGNLKRFAMFGIFLIFLGVGMSVAIGETRMWFEFPRDITLWSVCCYAGIAITVIAYFREIARWIRDIGPLRRPVELLCCLGVLLFPIYVLQSTVYLSAVTVELVSGMPLVRALSMMICVFAAVVTYPVWRIYRLYYAGRQ